MCYVLTHLSIFSGKNLLIYSFLSFNSIFVKFKNSELKTTHFRQLFFQNIDQGLACLKLKFSYGKLKEFLQQKDCNLLPLPLPSIKY